MARYIFDVHDDQPTEWGEDHIEFDGRDEIERRVRQLTEDAQARQAARGATEVLTTVFVHEEANGIVLTAYGRLGEEVRLVWTPG